MPAAAIRMPARPVDRMQIMAASSIHPIWEHSTRWKTLDTEDTAMDMVRTVSFQNYSRVSSLFYFFSRRYLARFPLFPMMTKYLTENKLSWTEKKGKQHEREIERTESETKTKSLGQ